MQFKKILIDVNHSLNQMQKSLLILLAFQCLFLNSHAQSKPSGVEISRMVEILPTSQVRKTTTKPPALSLRHYFAVYRSRVDPSSSGGRGGELSHYNWVQDRGLHKILERSYDSRPLQLSVCYSSTVTDMLKMTRQYFVFLVRFFWRAVL